MRNYILRLSAIALLGVWLGVVSGCGGNSTPVGITVTPNPATVVLGKPLPFTAIVSGTATTTVTWQICLPPSPTNAQPTVCSPAAPGQTQLPVGYGIITTGANSTPGGTYTAPTTLPPTNGFLVVATSTVNSKAFGTAVVNVISGTQVTVTPSSATIATGEHQQFLASVNGGTATGTNVTWEVAGIAGGTQTDGFICPSASLPASCTPGEYFAPVGAAPGQVTITAVSASDSSESGVASLTVVASVDPVLTSMSPNTVGEGSVQQDVYLNGTGFLTTSTVLAGNPLTPVPTTFISSILLRATLPENLLSGPGPAPVQIVVQTQDGSTSNVLPGAQGLTIVPTQPIVLASLPNTLTPSGSSTNLSLIGGYFSANSPTTVSFNGQTLAANVNSSRQLTANIASGAVPAPGLYPLIVRNGDVVAPDPGVSGINIAVEPSTNSIPSAPQSSFAVGPAPQAIAIDPALGLAVVVNQKNCPTLTSPCASIINLATNTPVPGSPVPVGNSPTSVAIDDQLPNHIAAVTNSADNTISVINLTTLAVTTLNLPNPNTAPNPAPVPWAIGINPLTHRGLVAFQKSNLADVVDFSNGVPTFVQSVGGTFTLFSTGTFPSVAVDPRLNWAIATPGGQGTVDIVDLGHNAAPNDPLRPPTVLGTLTISATIQGVGINTETHQALFADPNGSISQGGAAPNSISTFSLLDQTVKPVFATLNGSPINVPGLVASAVNSLQNIGIAVNENGSGFVVDVANGLVLQTITGLNVPAAVAIDAVTNTAYVVNSGNNTVSVVPLSTSGVNPLQIVESNPSITYVQSPNAGLSLSVVGAGFTGASQVLLDGVPVPTVLVNSRELVGSVPASMLSSARGYVVYVQNSASALSNVVHLNVIQPVTVGALPVGVAVDNARDQAVVTNSGSGDISVVNLLTGAVVTPQSSTSFLTGASPFGVAVLPRLGLAFVVNNGSNNATILDEAGLNGAFAPPVTVPLCGTCVLPIGATIDPDTALALFTLQLTTPSNGNQGELGQVSIAGATPATVPGANLLQVDLTPLGLAVDPSLNGDPSQAVTVVATAAGVNQATGAGTSALDFVSSNAGSVTNRVNNLFLPTDVTFDPVNQVFLATDSAINNIFIVNPASSVLASIAASINPTSLDYSYNASALVTANSATSTISVIDYVCPPNDGVNCPVPHVQSVLATGSLVPSSSAVAVGVKAIGIDFRLNLIVEVDEANNRVLLVPLQP
jgi:DNA-binding beta-propeller fold protein YncE